VRRDATGRALAAAKAASAWQIHAGEHAEAKLGCSHLHISPLRQKKLQANHRSETWCSHLHISPQACTTPPKHEPEMHDGVSVLGVPGRP